MQTLACPQVCPLGQVPQFKVPPQPSEADPQFLCIALHVAGMQIVPVPPSLGEWLKGWDGVDELLQAKTPIRKSAAPRHLCFIVASVQKIVNDQWVCNMGMANCSVSE
jgi:hypothetical protein